MPPSQYAIWKNRAKPLGMTGITAVVGALGSIARNKLFAITLNPAGYGVLAQVLSGQIWLGTLTGGGLSLPLSYAIARARGDGDQAAVRRATWSVFIAVSTAALIVCAAGLAAAPAISTALLGTAEHAGLVRLSMLGVAGLAAQVMLQGLFAGYADIQAPLSMAILGNVAATAVVFALIPRFGLAGAVLGVACFYPAAIAGTMFLKRATYRDAFQPPPSPRFDRATITSLLAMAGASLALALFDQGTMVAARAHYVRAHGAAANGLLQAALGLSQQIGAVFYSYLGSYVFGRISSLPGIIEVRDATRRQWRAAVVVAGGACAFMMLAAGPVLRLLYSNRFEGARAFMAWTLLGEFCRIAMQTWAVGALRVGGVRLWLPIGFVFTGTLAAAYTLSQFLGAGTYSLPYAYLAAGLAGLVTAGVLLTRRGVSLAGRDLVLFCGVLAVLAALAFRMTR